jgi:hypothetical protein
MRPGGFEPPTRGLEVRRSVIWGDAPLPPPALRTVVGIFNPLAERVGMFPDEFAALGLRARSLQLPVHHPVRRSRHVLALLATLCLLTVG